jgi:hypothetical protein
MWTRVSPCTVGIFDTADDTFSTVATMANVAGAYTCPIFSST